MPSGFPFVSLHWRRIIACVALATLASPLMTAASIKPAKNGSDVKPTDNVITASATNSDSEAKDPLESQRSPSGKTTKIETETEDVGPSDVDHLIKYLEDESVSTGKGQKKGHSNREDASSDSFLERQKRNVMMTAENMAAENGKREKKAGRYKRDLIDEGYDFKWPDDENDGVERVVDGAPFVNDDNNIDLADVLIPPQDSLDYNGDSEGRDYDQDSSDQLDYALLPEPYEELLERQAAEEAVRELINEYREEVEAEKQAEGQSLPDFIPVVYRGIRGVFVPGESIIRQVAEKQPALQPEVTPEELEAAADKWSLMVGEEVKKALDEYDLVYRLADQLKRNILK